MLVATVRALKHHGGIEDDPRVERVRGLAAIADGAANLHRHLGIVRELRAAVRGGGQPPARATPTTRWSSCARWRSRAARTAAEVNDGFARGGEGAAELAEAVADACEQPSEFKLTYEDDDPIEVKIRKVASQVYGAKDVVFYLEAERKIRQYTEDGLDKLPICMAKTHLSLSADPALLNAPEDFTLPVRDIRAYTGAGWLVPLCGDIQQMPGPRQDAGRAERGHRRGGEDRRALLSGECRATSPTCCARARARRARPRSPCSRRRWTSAARSRTRTAAEAAALSGLPEAAVYGISTFYDDLVQPRGRRHVSVCTGTACWASDFGAHVAAVGERLGLAPGERSDDGEVSLGATVCLGFCHTAAAVRDGDVVDAGPGVAERVAARRAARRRPSRTSESVLDEPVLLAPGRLRRASATRSRAHARAAARRRSRRPNVRGRGGAGFPAGTKWEFAAQRRATPTG